MDERKVVRRPGRKLGAERRRIAREILRRFYNTDEFAFLPSEVRLAILELCPELDSHVSFPAENPQKKSDKANRGSSLWMMPPWG